MVNDDAYAKFARYYDAYVEGFQADIEMYRHFLRPGMKVLEIGCGSGRILSHLVGSGVQVLGVDISQEMLDLAQKKLSNFTSTGVLRLAHHNVAAIPLDEEFDRVYISFYTFNYLLDKNEALSLLKNVMSSMKAGALLIIDLFYPLAYRNPEIEGLWEEKSFNLNGRKTKFLDKRTVKDGLEERVQVFIYEDCRDEIITYRKYYDKHAITRMLENIGFAKIKCTENYNYNHFHSIEYDEQTDNSFVIIAAKP